MHKFQETVEDLKRLAEGSSSCSSKLREENAEMARRVGEMAGQCEEADRKFRAAMQERELEKQLHEAQVI